VGSLQSVSSQASNTDCEDGSMQDDDVRAAELQVFER
jgi:hypothetical protein